MISHSNCRWTKLFCTLTTILFTTLSFAQENDSVSSEFERLVIEDIVCAGNTTTRCDFILKKYYQTVGEVVDPIEIADAKLRLGTLIQFRDIDIRLQRGSQRGKVIVVVNVKEASNIQYNTKIGFWRSGQNTTVTDFLDPQDFDVSRINTKTSAKNNSATLELGVTNYNFLGSAKQLSFSIFTDIMRADIDRVQRFDLVSSQNSMARNQTLEADTNFWGGNIQYTDPHLFGFKRIFFDLNLVKGQTKTEQNGEVDSLYIVSDVNTQSFGSSSVPSTTLNKSDIKEEGINIQLGSRFASVSQVALSYSKHEATFDASSTLSGSFLLPDNTESVFETMASTEYVLDSDTLSFDYLRDSRDDTIFPTGGSLWSAALSIKEFSLDLEHTLTSGSITNKEKGLSFNIEKHYGFSQDAVVNLNAGYLFANVSGHILPLNGVVRLNVDDTKTRIGVVGIGVTKINAKNNEKGEYSGWALKTEFTSNSIDADAFFSANNRNQKIDLSVEYIFQTPTLVTRFELTLGRVGRWF